MDADIDYEHKCNCPNCPSMRFFIPMTADEMRRYRNYLLNMAKLYSDMLKHSISIGHPHSHN